MYITYNKIYITQTAKKLRIVTDFGVAKNYDGFYSPIRVDTYVNPYRICVCRGDKCSPQNLLQSEKLGVRVYEYVYDRNRCANEQPSFAELIRQKTQTQALPCGP